MSITGCSSSIDTDEVVATVGDEDITMGVANFYARMMQGQYETYYAQLMGTTGEDMWAQEVSDGRDDGRVHERQRYDDSAEYVPDLPTCF